MRWIGIGLIGLLGGWVSGLFGVGGGVIFVPLLVLFLGVNLHVAIGTSLVTIIPTALVGAYRHFLGEGVDLKLALLLAVFAIVGAWLGAGLSLKLDVALLRKFYAVFLVLVALRLFFE
ncbi:MAG: sulfite exporter TauE/SafE family protein [Candidatus Omnitrophica bacterium]|nr:sulfite exporter TauE/SafE family protein [Candidatus Omnitrophota bacterium]